MQKVKIITWNVNSVKARLPNVVEFLRNENPDIILLQELKCQTDDFPRIEFEELGYNLAILGQKTYNGVAVLSKFPISEFICGIPNYTDENSRYIEAVISIKNIAIRVASVYVPNGQEVGSDKFKYKLEFFEKLYQHLENIKKYDEAIIIGGDFNCALENIDVFDPKSLKETVCFHSDEKRALNKIINLGYADLFRAKHEGKQVFSWWDYRGNSWSYNKGMRIDYVFGNPLACDKLISSDILTNYRGKEKASDHAPVEIVCFA
jgi:exodeoxyribonuclease-3